MEAAQSRWPSSAGGLHNSLPLSCGGGGETCLVVFLGAVGGPLGGGKVLGETFGPDPAGLAFCSAGKTDFQAKPSHLQLQQQRRKAAAWVSPPPLHRAESGQQAQHWGLWAQVGREPTQ